MQRLHNPEQLDGVVHHDELVHLFTYAEIGVEHVLQGSVVAKWHDQDANLRVRALDNVSAARGWRQGLNNARGVQGIDAPGEPFAYHPLPSSQPSTHLDGQATETLVILVETLATSACSAS